MFSFNHYFIILEPLFFVDFNVSAFVEAQKQHQKKHALKDAKLWQTLASFKVDSDEQQDLIELAERPVQITTGFELIEQ